mmetsp:Transcript_65229/g.131202  ORF Transcript_65229/g.131202 Transcript_65229/m.131202 type:complete len:280 (-) Transcript_65229:266-1105(-)
MKNNVNFLGIAWAPPVLPLSALLAVTRALLVCPDSFTGSLSKGPCQSPKLLNCFCGCVLDHECPALVWDAHVNSLLFRHLRLTGLVCRLLPLHVCVHVGFLGHIDCVAQKAELAHRPNCNGFQRRTALVEVLFDALLFHEFTHGPLMRFVDQIFDFVVLSCDKAELPVLLFPLLEQKDCLHAGLRALIDRREFGNCPLLGVCTVLHVHLLLYRILHSGEIHVFVVGVALRGGNPAEVVRVIRIVPVAHKGVVAVVVYPRGAGGIPCSDEGRYMRAVSFR